MQKLSGFSVAVLVKRKNENDESDVAAFDIPKSDVRNLPGLENQVFERLPNTVVHIFQWAWA